LRPPHRLSKRMADSGRSNNLRLALILASVAAVFFLGVVLKYALFSAS
jgi:hypothetical protein